MAEEVGFSRAQAGLDRGKLEILWTETFETCSDVVGVVGGYDVKYDHVVVVRDHTLQNADGCVNDLDKPPWRGVATPCSTMRHSINLVGVTKTFSEIGSSCDVELVEVRHYCMSNTESQVFTLFGGNPAPRPRVGWSS